jgi:hypothetical protein
LAHAAAVSAPAAGHEHVEHDPGRGAARRARHEIESITGYIVELAAKHGVPAPYNRTIHRLGLERFRPGFEPLPCEEVLAAVEAERAGQIDKPAAMDRP